MARPGERWDAYVFARHEAADIDGETKARVEKRLNRIDQLHAGLNREIDEAEERYYRLCSWKRRVVSFRARLVNHPALREIARLENE